MQGFVAAGVGVSLIAELGLQSVRDDIVVRAARRARRRSAQVFADRARRATARRPRAAMLEVLRAVGAEHAARRPVLELVS